MLSLLLSIVVALFVFIVYNANARHKLGECMIRKRLKLNDIKVREKVITKRGDDFDSLVISIRRSGLIQPILLDRQNYIISGYRRYMALKEIGTVSLEKGVHYNITNDGNTTVMHLDSNLEIERPSNFDELLHKRREIIVKEMRAENIPIKKSLVDARVAKAHNISRDIVRSSRIRRSRASDMVIKAQLDNKLSASVVTHITKLPKRDQDEILPYMYGAKNAFSFNIVEMARNNGIKPAIAMIQETPEDKLSTIFKIRKSINNIEKYLNTNDSKINYLFFRKDLITLKRTITWYQKKIKLFDNNEVIETPGSGPHYREVL